MRSLATVEMNNVSGGDGAIEAAKNICTSNNLPADTKVTITTTVGSSAGLNSTHVNATTTTSIETTCGALTAPKK